MSKRLHLLGAIVLATTLQSAAARAQRPAPAPVDVRGVNDPSIQNALEVIANDFMSAWQKQDMVTISTILAPDFLFAGPHGVKTRTYTLNVLTHCTLGKFTLQDFQMRQTSPDSAILLYTIHRDLACFGKKDLENTLNTDTFVRRNGRWSIVLTTEGEILEHFQFK